MDESIDVRDQVAPDLKEWETPELVVEDVRRVTHGGPETFTEQGDGAFYT